MLNITLIGYGKMGKMVEKIAEEAGHNITSRIDPQLYDNCMDAATLHETDICIDFSHPHSVLSNIKKTVELGIDMVVGTTGWDDHLAEVQHLVTKNETGFLYAPNFSIGIHLFQEIVTHAAEHIMPTRQYDVAGMEAHHKHKADTPSGTAKAIAQAIAKTTAINPEDIPFSSIRCGSIPGTHTIVFDSPSDTITLTHQARDREGFAKGAVTAAEWLHGRKGFYTLQDMFHNGAIRCRT